MCPSENCAEGNFKWQNIPVFIFLKTEQVNIPRPVIRGFYGKIFWNMWRKHIKLPPCNSLFRFVPNIIQTFLIPAESKAKYKPSKFHNFLNFFSTKDICEIFWNKGIDVKRLVDSNLTVRKLVFLMFVQVLTFTYKLLQYSFVRQ